MRAVIVICCLLVSSIVHGQIKTQAVASLPKNIRFKGKLVQALRFQDKAGSYLAFITQTGAQPQKNDDEFKQAHLYGYLYQLNNNVAPAPLWQMHDMVTDCNLDMTAAFVPGSFTVTDLNNNGKAEVWTVYRIGCRGDVSPSELKIIMHEGVSKYAMRGIGRIKVGKVIQHDGGVITSDDFRKGNIIFRQYAGRLWGKYVTETL